MRGNVRFPAENPRILQDGMRSAMERLPARSGC
jgi:hypothetical protein